MNRGITVSRSLPLVGAVVLLLAAAVCANAGTAKVKPMIPVQVAIEPTAPMMKAQDIRPGDVVEFRVVALATRGAEEMTIEIRLLDGAELVSGDLRWSGSVLQSEEKQLIVSVRAPARGTGRVMASVVVTRNGKRTIAKQTVYTLGSLDTGPTVSAAPGTRRDGRGRKVVEY